MVESVCDARSSRMESGSLLNKGDSIITYNMWNCLCFESDCVDGEN